MLKKKGFKVVSLYMGDRFSSRKLGKLTKYDVKKWMRAPFGCGPFAVFKSYKDARDFAHGNGYEVWECIYIPSKCDVLFSPKFSNPKELNFLRKDKCPPGTDFAEKIILTRKWR